MNDDKTPIRPLAEFCILRPAGFVYDGTTRMLYRCDTCHQEGTFSSEHPVQCLDKEADR